jgi:hemin uptake protein HemP
MESTLQPSLAVDTRLNSSTPVVSTARVDSRDLLRGAREIVIRHGEHEYRLRHTQNDKLILTK